MGSYLGINIGGTTCSVSRGNAAGEILVRESFHTTDVKATLDGLSRLAQKLCTPDVVACGVSCGGPLDAATGVVMSPPNLPGWDNIPITKIISGATGGKPAFLMNDANAGGLAEWLFGTGGKCPSLVFLTCGTGLGSGIVINGEILDGVNGNGGEVGHIRLTKDGPLGYHKNGSFEGWCSGTGFARFAGIDAKTAAERARKGDAKCLADFQEMGRKLGEGLAIVIDTINPARIALGGVYMRCVDLLEPSMREVLKKEALPQSLAVCEIVPSVCGEEIGDKAALAVALYYCPENPVDLLVRRYPKLSVCRASVQAAADALVGAFKDGHQLLVCGNGGSWSDAHHIAGELMKCFTSKCHAVDPAAAAALPGGLGAKFEKGYPVRVLGAEGAYASAFENDVDPSLVFAQEVQVSGRPGDVFLGITTSGNSKNVVAAARTAKALGLKVLGLTGQGGGALAPLCDTCVRVPETETYRVQELHLPVYHALCIAVDRALRV